MVYSFDMDLKNQSPEIELLSSLYNVNSTPTIVSPNQILTGLQTAQQLDQYYNSSENQTA
jgi:hypothetical protein